MHILNQKIGDLLHSKIIKYANLEHIKLDQQDLSLYSEYMDKCPEHIGYMEDTGCSLKKGSEADYRKLLYTNAVLNHDFIEPHISFQEMQAINIYTTEWSRLINGILRGTADIHKEKPAVFKFALIQAVVCGSGLNKLPKTRTIGTVRRGEDYSNADRSLAEKIHGERTKAAATKGVVIMRGFTSTTTWSVRDDCDASSLYLQNNPIRLDITPSKGAYIAPIAAQPREREFLIPPTRMRITQYTEFSRRAFFSVQPVSYLEPMEPVEAQEPFQPEV